jgi:predicted secreted hydrolase
MGTERVHQPGRGYLRRIATGFAVLCALMLLAVVALLLLARETASPAPPINAVAPAGSQLHYPYKLVPADPRLDFPAAEGRQLDMDSDTWFLEGVLEGQESGRRFSFIVVYFVSRIYGVVPFNFYSLTFYDLDKADYGTFTQYDVTSMKASTGFLDLSVPVNGADASWTTTLDDAGNLVPFSYRIDLPGEDQQGRAMHLNAAVRMVNPPVAVGADTYNGLITVLKQANTYSYFQTGAVFDGTLTWGDHSEAVKGHLGHMDRQMFPQFSGVHNSRDGRNLSHEWRTFFLDNGTDFSSWRQFDRTDKNSEYSYGGATTFDPVQGARYAGDIVYENLSYVRTENHPIKPLVSPRANVLYFPNRHRLSSKSLGLELEADPIVNAPLLAFPVEYMHGPVRLSGTQAGQPVSGIGSFELTLHLYRDFELVTVLSDSVRHLPAEALLPSTTPVEEMLKNIAEVKEAVTGGDHATARSLADGTVRAKLQTLAEPYRGNMLQILDDLVAVLPG